MVHLVSPTGTALDVLKKAARQRQNDRKLPFTRALNQIAQEEFCRMRRKKLVPHSGYGGPFEEELLEQASWRDLVALSWSFDPAKRTLTSPVPRKEIGVLESRYLSHILDWSKIDPDPNLFGKPQVRHNKWGADTLNVWISVERRGVCDYPARVCFVGQDEMETVPVFRATELPGSFETLEENLAAAMKLEWSLHQALRDAKSSGYQVHPRAKFELQAIEMQNSSTQLLCILGPADSIPGGFGAWFSHVPYFDRPPMVHLASFGHDRYFSQLSLESLTLQAWNGIVASCSTSEQRQTIKANREYYDVAIPLTSTDVASVRAAIFHPTQRGPAFIHEEFPWMLARPKKGKISRVSEILDGTRRGIVAPLMAPS